MTRDPARIPVVLDEVAQVWSRWPDLRLGQLIDNAANYAGVYRHDLLRIAGKPDVFNIEDDRLLSGLREMVRINDQAEQDAHEYRELALVFERAGEDRQGM